MAETTPFDANFPRSLPLVQKILSITGQHETSAITLATSCPLLRDMSNYMRRENKSWSSWRDNSICVMLYRWILKSAATIACATISPHEAAKLARDIVVSVPLSVKCTWQFTSTKAFYSRYVHSLRNIFRLHQNFPGPKEFNMKAPRLTVTELFYDGKKGRYIASFLG